MALKLFEVVEQFMKDTFSVQLTQFDKTGSIRKSFISQGDLIIHFHFRNQKSITFSVTFKLLLFDSGVCFPFNNGNIPNLKINHKSNRGKLKLSVNKFLTLFPEKKNRKISKNYIRVLTRFITPKKNTSTHRPSCTSHTQAKT